MTELEAHTVRTELYMLNSGNELETSQIQTYLIMPPHTR